MRPYELYLAKTAMDAEGAPKALGGLVHMADDLAMPLIHHFLPRPKQPEEQKPTGKVG
jgi:hypothetical protein